jgi:two-component system, NtrC family, response regulator AtoC
MERSRVLVVEDRPAILKLLSSILSDAYDVVTAPDGAVALELLELAPAEVVLTDIRMPGVSGFEVLRMALDRAPQARVLMMTAYANVPDAVAAMRLGAYDYVAKPLEADEIRLIVARAVADARAHDDASSVGHDGAGGADSAEVSVGFHRAVEEARERASREYLQSLMCAFHGNVTEAAKRAGMTRESLHRVMKKYGVRSGHHHPAAADADGARGDRGGVAV